MMNIGKLALATGPALGALGAYGYTANTHSKKEHGRFLTIDLNALERNEPLTRTIASSTELDQVSLQNKLIILLNRVKSTPPKSKNVQADKVSRSQFGSMMSNMGVIDQEAVDVLYKGISNGKKCNYETMVSRLCSPEFIFDACKDKNDLVSRDNFTEAVKGLVYSHLNKNGNNLHCADNDVHNLLSESLTQDLFSNQDKDTKMSRQQFLTFIDDNNNSSLALRQVLNDFNDKAYSVLL